MEQKTLRERAKKLRSNQTDAERKLWYHIRARRFENRKFYRQFIIAPYIVDFICRELKLIIELDGGQHMDNQKNDLQRTNYLKAKGFKVIRFWNNQIFEDIDAVLETLSLSLSLSQRDREL